MSPSAISSAVFLREIAKLSPLLPVTHATYLERSQVHKSLLGSRSVYHLGGLKQHRGSELCCILLLSENCGPSTLRCIRQEVPMTSPHGRGLECSPKNSPSHPLRRPVCRWLDSDIRKKLVSDNDIPKSYLHNKPGSSNSNW